MKNRLTRRRPKIRKKLIPRRRKLTYKQILIIGCPGLAFSILRNKDKQTINQLPPTP